MHKIAGSFYFLAGTFILMGIVLAEIFYPGYNISLQMISMLGSYPPGGTLVEPSAFIFDKAMILSGVTLIIAMLFLYQTKIGKFLSFSTLVMGVGILGVGLFPAYTGTPHDISALLTFGAGGLSAIFSSKILTPPLKYIAAILGAVSLTFLVLGILFSFSVVPEFGKGGAERLVAYPIILWLVSFGGYLMAEKS